MYITDCKAVSVGQKDVRFYKVQLKIMAEVLAWIIRQGSRQGKDLRFLCLCS